VCKAAGLPIPPLQDPVHVNNIATQMEEIVIHVYLCILFIILQIPLSKLNAWREYREKCLAALTKLKRDLEKDEPK
jgi:hypothetical protein